METIVSPKPKKVTNGSNHQHYLKNARVTDKKVKRTTIDISQRKRSTSKNKEDSNLTKLISQAISDISIKDKEHLSARNNSIERPSPVPATAPKIPSLSLKHKNSIFSNDNKSQRSYKESERYKEYDT